MTQEQRISAMLTEAYDQGVFDYQNDQVGYFEVTNSDYFTQPNWISLPVDAFGSDQNTLFRLAILESLSLGNSKDVGLAEVCFEFHPSISVGYVKGVLEKWGCIFTSGGVGQEDIRNPAEITLVSPPEDDGLFHQYKMSEIPSLVDDMDILADYKSGDIEVIRHVVGVDLWAHDGNVRANMDMFDFIHPYVDGVVTDDNEVYLSEEIDWSATSLCYDDGNNAHYLQLAGQGYIGTNTIRGVIVRIPYTFRWMIEKWSDYLTEVAKSMGKTEWLAHLNSVIGKSSPTAQPTCIGDCGKCSPAEVHECHVKRKAKNGLPT